MNAADYAPVEPLDREPCGGYVNRRGREEALRDALRGVELGTYDERIVAWMVQILDDSTLRVMVSLIERARVAEKTK